MVEGLVQVVPRRRRAGRRYLIPVDLQVARGVGRLDVVELAVRVFQAGELERDVLPGHPPAEPAALHVGHVPDEASSDRPDGGTARCLSCSAVTPAHWRAGSGGKVQPGLEHLAHAGDVGGGRGSSFGAVHDMRSA